MGHNGDALLALASQFLALAEKQTATGPFVIAHRLMGTSLSTTGAVLEGRTHLDKAIGLYDRSAHSPLATRFGQDVGMVTLSWRSWTLWVLGYPDAAFADADRASKSAREIGHVPTLIYALFFSAWTAILRGNYTEANSRAEELIALGEQKGAAFWKAGGIVIRGCLLTLMGQAEAAIKNTNAGLNFWRSTGARVTVSMSLPYLATAYASHGEFEDASRCIREAFATVETTKERWAEAEVHRIAGEIALKLPERDAAKAEAYFESALSVARQQQAKSWELRAAMSMARLWREQGKREEARELLAPVYGWFSEGFDTRDLKEAKALLDELAT